MLVRMGRAALLGAVTIMAPLLPASSQAHSHREASAHVHGIAEFSFVISGQELLVTLDSPLANVLGFEHAPGSAAERKTADAATIFLNDPMRVASPSPAAQCSAVKPSIVLPFDVKTPVTKVGHAASDAHAGHEHMDIEASYTFSCKAMDRLEQIDVTAFKTFPGIKTAEAVILGPHMQLSRQLSPSSSIVKLK